MKEQNCSYCGESYASPVELHHDGEECAVNQLTRQFEKTLGRRALRDREELTMIALALKTHGIEGVTPERGVEILISRRAVKEELEVERDEAETSAMYCEDELETTRKALKVDAALQAETEAKLATLRAGVEAEIEELRQEVKEMGRIVSNARGHRASEVKDGKLVVRLIEHHADRLSTLLSDLTEERS